jgi:hypothetical protein
MKGEEMYPTGGMRPLSQSIRTLLLFSLAVGRSLYAGYEIADITDASDNDFRGYTRVYLDDGENPIEESEWEDFIPPEGYLKNSPRNPEFNAENTFGSPGMPAGEVIIENIGTDGSGAAYTWKFIAQIQSAMWGDHADLPFPTNPYRSASVVVKPPEGTIKFSSNEKNQEMIFWATEGDIPGGKPIKRYFITDQWGNKYIMGASGAPTDAELDDYFGRAVLPVGWTKSFGDLDETLHLLPAYGAGDQAHFNIFRESGDNTYFQIEWGESGESIASHIAGMAIWGGKESDTIRGRAGDDNLIHGAEGDDLIFALGQNDTIFGDAGVDTVVFAGNFTDYTLLWYANGGEEMILGGFGLEKTLYSIEWLQFDDQTIATESIPEPGVVWLIAGAGVILSGRMVRRRFPRIAEFAKIV